MSIIALGATDDPLRHSLEVTPGLCVGNPASQFLFGGAGMAAGLLAIETVTGRATVWAAAQYLSYAHPGTRLDLAVAVPVSGKYTSQARVTARAGDKEILTVNAALGDRPGFGDQQWARMPHVPPPEDCAPIEYNWVRRDDDINSRFDQRVAAGRFGGARAGPGASGEGGPSPDGIARMWVRPVGAVAVDRVTLAVMADFLPSGVGNALGTNAGGNSLDNTIRFGRLVATEWVLADIRIHAVAQGFVHGRVHLFAEDGVLLATASQSMILRVH